MKRAMQMFGVLGLLVAVVSMSAPMSAAQEDSGGPAKKAKAANKIYIIQMIESPVVDYKGGVAGLKATKPAKGQKIDPNSPHVIAYVAYLEGRHNEALNAVGGGRKIRDYQYTFNGFAAEITPAQAEAIKKVSGVVAVSKDELQTMDTSSTPAFLGLDAVPGGLWTLLGGLGSAGENIIIGDVDSGIWPESLSFSDRTGDNGNAKKDGKLSYQQIPGWHGKCTPGDQFTGSNCNQKLIGARFYNSGWGGDAGIRTLFPYEFVSPRDFNGHGTHTASTAGGNSGVLPTGPAAPFGAVSGIAPRARIAAYKALWHQPDGRASGFNSDLVAAIDQAVADGVDVINYSIEGTQTNFLDPVQVAFLYAANAGVFVSASAGNAGPTSSTVAHPGPWLTTVAAGTHNRNGEGSVTIGAQTYSGASFANAVTGNLVDASQSAVAGGSAANATLCFAAVDNGGTAVLDPAKVAGKIVLCDRGTNALVNKSLAVLQAGGIGMVLTNVAPPGATTTLALIHSVPSVHVAYTAANYAALHTAAQAGQLATINKATIVFNVAAPLTASFSSRGALRAGGGDLLKPDVIAPGQDILAAVAPPGNAGLSFSLYSGTSMSAPHVAGLAALLKDLHPGWTPMMIKSALMTSAGDVLDGPNTNPLVIFRQGAGHVAPNAAANPGLVYTAGWNEWLAFLCGTTTGVTPATCNALSGLGYSLDPSDLNVASIAIGDLAGIQKVTRKVTNIGSAPATYNASLTGMSGFTTVINPTSLALNPGQTKSYDVNFTRTTATLSSYTGGQLTWSDGTNNVRIPVVVRPVALAAPVQVSGNGGAISYPVKFGYDGPFTAVARGLIPATTTASSVSQDSNQDFDPASTDGTAVFTVVIPAGTTYARFSLFDANVSPASDLDVYVYRGATGTTLVGSSAGGTSAEEVNLINPAADTYRVFVHGFAVPGPAGTQASFTLFQWLLGSADAGNMTVSAPTTATTGGTGTITLTFSGLAAATKYFGSVAYSGVAGLPNPTIVRVDTP